MARGSKTKRGPNHYQLVVPLPKGEDGKRRNATEQFHGSASAADIALDLLKASVRAQQGQITNMTVTELFALWLPRWDEGCSPTTIRQHRATLKVINNDLGGIKIKDITSMYLETYITKITSPHTARKVHSALNLAFNWAERHDQVATNPLHRVDRPSEPQVDIRSPEPQQVLDILASARAFSPEMHTFVHLAVYTGARKSELQAARWGMLDLSTDPPQWTIDKSLVVSAEKGDPDVLKGTKTGKHRTIALDPATVSELKAHRKRMAQTSMEVGQPLTADTYVFADPYNRFAPWGVSQQAGRLTALAADAGWDGLSFKHLRNFHATEMIAAGVPIKIVSMRLGHTSSATTEKHYAKWLPATDAAHVDVIGARLHLAGENIQQNSGGFGG